MFFLIKKYLSKNNKEGINRIIKKIKQNFPVHPSCGAVADCRMIDGISIDS
jgi:hypothetical protein